MLYTEMVYLSAVNHAGSNHLIAATRPEVKPTTYRSLSQRSNRYTTKPSSHYLLFLELFSTHSQKNNHCRHDTNAAIPRRLVYLPTALHKFDDNE